jgi:hypothetical protein
MRTHRLAALAVVTMLAAACGASGRSHALATTPTTAASAGPTTTTGPTSAADQVKAQSLVLTDADMAHWTSTPHQADPATAASDAALAACIGVPDSFPHRDADASSADYSMGDLTVDDEVTYYTDNSYVASDIAEVSNPKAKGCFETSGRKAVMSGLSPGDTIQALTVTITPGTAPGRSRQVAVITLMVTVSVSGQPQTEYNTQILMAGPRLEENVGFTSTAPFPQDQLDAISTTLATRLAAAT